jgi:hypothetical protein
VATRWRRCQFGDLLEITVSSERLELEMFLGRQDAGAPIRWMILRVLVRELASLSSYVDDVLGHGETLAAIVDAGDVIAHGHEEKKCKPKDTGNDYELRATLNVFGMHEEKNDEGSLESGDTECYDDLKFSQVDISDRDRGARQNQQSENYGGVRARLNDVVLVLAVLILRMVSHALLLPMPVDQIQKWK